MAIVDGREPCKTGQRKTGCRSAVLLAAAVALVHEYTHAVCDGGRLLLGGSSLPCLRLLTTAHRLGLGGLAASAFLLAHGSIYWAVRGVSIERVLPDGLPKADYQIGADAAKTCYMYV